MSSIIEKLGDGAPTDKVTVTILAGAVALALQTITRMTDYNIPIDESLIDLLTLVVMGLLGWAKSESRPSPSAVAEVGRQLEEWARAQEAVEAERGH